MLELDLFIILLIIIFLLRNNLTKSFYGLWYLITRSKKWASNLTAFFLFLGTLVHELSHFLAATFLGVATGEFNLLPELVENQGIRMGSVKIAKCDFVRKSLIGLAPVVSGITIIFFLARMLPNSINKLLTASVWQILIYVLVMLMILVISSTMFSSKQDLTEIVPFIVLVLIIYGIFWSLEIKIDNQYLVLIEGAMDKINRALISVIMINGIILIGLKGLVLFMEKVLKRKVRFR